MTEYGMGRGKVFPAADARSLLSPARRLVQSPTRIARRLGASSEARVLELGCGPGYFSEALARAVPDGQVVLVDLQHEMLRLVRERLADRVDAVRLVRADAVALPIDSESIDAVAVILVLGEVPDRVACLAEIHRVLRIGGIVMFAETRRDSDFIRFRDLRALVEPQGFELLDRRGPGWEYTARFAAVRPQQVGSSSL